MTERERPLRPFLTFSVLVFTAGLSVLAATASRMPPEWNLQMGLLVVAALLSETYALQLRSFTISLAFPLIVAAMITGGPAGAGFVATASFTNLQEVRDRRPLSAFLFNFGQLACAGSAGGWAYASVWRMSVANAVPLPAADMPLALLGVLLAAGVFSGVNLLLTATAVRLGKGIPFSSVVRDFAEHLPTQVALAFVGLLIAQVLSINPLAFALFLFPLFLARQVYQHYAELRDAYVDTVRSLVRALEAKDQYTSGHSERVARYALQLGLHLRMEERELERLERAALLHDIGKLALPAAVLTKPLPLTDNERSAVEKHPATGAGMVRKIPALRQLSDCIEAHHERVDGGGYPAGVAEDDIPLSARMLAIADAYDAMTTHRAYRRAMSHAEALAELAAGAGTQFDARLVRAFTDAGVGRRDTPAACAHAIEPDSTAVATAG